MASYNIRTCKECGFILGTKPNLKEESGVCLACLNAIRKKTIDFSARQEWLTDYIAKNITNAQYDCVVAVSGGKDSHSLVYRLIHEHGVKNPLLVTVEDEFTSTQAGTHNRKNISEYFELDHISFRCNPKKFKKQTLNDFEDSLNPLRWIEEQLCLLPISIAKNYGIKLVFFGENSDFEYGSSTTLNIFSTLSDETTKVIYLGAIWPYSIDDALNVAKRCGFKDLKDFNEWERQGNIDYSTQIDSIGYIVHLWCKFVKFGFQRVSDIACRQLREGIFSHEQAERLIRDNDYILDPAAKHDFCNILGITEDYFDQIVDKHAQLDIVHKDCNGIYRRNDYK